MILINFEKVLQVVLRILKIKEVLHITFNINGKIWKVVIEVDIWKNSEEVNIRIAASDLFDRLKKVVKKLILTTFLIRVQTDSVLLSLSLLL